MTSGEASILGKLEQIEHNQKKIMEAILVIANINQDYMGNIIKNVIQENWTNLDQELAEHKKLKAQAKKNGYSLSQWKKKLENEKNE